MSSAGLGRLLIVDDELGAAGHHGGGSPTVA
jgi:hypothetical protein